MMPSRLAKLERIRQRGFDPYPHRYRRSHTALEAIAFYKQLISSPSLEAPPKVSLAGRLVSNRPMGKVTFSHIQDGTGRVQIYLREALVGEENYAYYKDFDLGDFIGVEGTLFQTKAGEITVEVHQFVMLAKTLRPLPEKWHGLVDVEKRFRQRYLDLIANEKSRQTFVLRSRIIASIRKYMDSQGFLEVETPVLQPIYGGALARPFVTYYNALETNMYLRIATELYLKRLIIGGFERVYEIGKDFRNEGLSARHNPEFTMMESYEAYADYHNVMEMIEEMILFVVQEVLGSEKVTYQGMVIDLTPPWQRITISDALQQFTGIDLQQSMDGQSLAAQAAAKGVAVDTQMGEGKIIDVLISDLVAPNLIQPTFLIDYPLELSPLAKRKPDNPTLVERFEPYIAGLELGNAFSELNDPLDQRERFIQQAHARELGDEEAQPLDEDFLVALEHGMPPTGGMGLGIDRLVMILADQPAIREVLLFPQLRVKN